ncbi:MAG: diacylglycerol/lipid kinase family protein [Gaiellaceae bacterium]|jgi:diacylglycerol kinase family enzyme
MGRSAHSSGRETHTPGLASLLIINPSSGRGGPDPDELRREAESLGIHTHLLQPREDPAAVANESDADVLGIAGGDGSLAAVADVALERDALFVCVPYGTRNHFARDLGLDRNDAPAALHAFEGSERRVDVGRADERLFLNNVSLGVYARLVHRREHHRRRRQAFARLRAWAILLTHRDPLGITIDGDAIETRVVLVANNAYTIDLPTIGARERLDEGALHLYVPGDERVGERFVVDSAQGRLQAAVDGEPDVLETPIEFTIEPRALRVLVPDGD